MVEALRYVLFYESGDLSLAAENFPAHKARYTEFMQRGVLLALGPFSDGSGSIAVFSTREAADEFVSGDPFVCTAWSASGRSANGAKQPPELRQPHSRRPGP